MDRRQYLRTTATVGVATTGVAGCLGGGNPNTVLGEPDRDFDSEEVPYPAWGEQVPAVTVPDPIAGESVSSRDVDVVSIYTFFFSHCMTVCPVLIGTLRNIQTQAATDGYADSVLFLPMTFDPARDDAARLEEYAGEMNVNLELGNWTFLRPETESRARTVVGQEFGIRFEKDPIEDGEGYMFIHAAVILLVNDNGYVERAYRGQSPDQTAIIDDLATVR